MESVWLQSLCFISFMRRKRKQRKMVEIVNYVKVQCSTYTHYNESSESKSLLRAIESARQMSTNIDMKNRKRRSDKSGVSERQSADALGGWYPCTDAEGKTDCEYSMDESLTNEITEYLQKRNYHGFRRI